MLYNIFMVIEFSVYAFFFTHILKNRIGLQLAKGFLYTFPIAGTFLLFSLYNNLFRWASLVEIIGTLFTCLFCIVFYYEIFSEKQPVELRRSAEFWIVTGLLVFYSTTIPYTGMLNYLYQKHQVTAKDFLLALHIANVLLYSIISYAYLCRNFPLKSRL